MLKLGDSICFAYNISWVEITNEVFVIDEINGDIFIIKGNEKEIWKLIDQKKNVSTLIDFAMHELNIPEIEIASTISKFRQKHWIEE